MNIFLTGDIQVGKTTVIQNTITLLNKNYGGFKTYFGPDRNLPNRLLYMNSADEPHIFSEEHGIVRFSEVSKPQLIGDRFNLYGVELIRQARDNKELIVMDECGGFERNSFVFQKEIFDTLDGSIPILGVIKLDSTGWVDYIKNHPNVKLITVTNENRDELPKIIVKYFK